VAARGKLTLLFTGGVISFLAGTGIVIAGLSPMWAHNTETATMWAPAPAARSADDSTVNRISNATSSVLDRPVNGVAFGLSIPKLGYRATVLEGVESSVLDQGPGHYPTTAWPGHSGVVGVAAHNVYWLSFDQLAAGDRIEIQTRRALLVYDITGSKITDPNDRTVLVSSGEHRLALTTCYPLWAGAFATRRLIFFAREIDATQTGA
jgi:sortase A